TVTISSLAHAAKPAPQIFRIALEKHAIDPEEALHVGDSLREDVEGARKAGLHTALLDRDGTLKPVDIPILKNLEEVIPLLDRIEE
ncbi:MAG: HAD-IA family hydrolase, partial [Nitrospira sp.]|nr:HAD-IA family hydrolase [Nitrospira sp.]